MFFGRSASGGSRSSTSCRCCMYSSAVSSGSGVTSGFSASRWSLLSSGSAFLVVLAATDDLLLVVVADGLNRAEATGSLLEPGGAIVALGYAVRHAVQRAREDGHVVITDWASVVVRKVVRTVA